MTALASTLQAFFQRRLIAQRNASPRTVAAYRDTIRLLLRFAFEQTGKQPCQLDFADLDADLIGSFLDHLEDHRGNSPRTRNARLAAIHSLYRYAALRHPEHAQTIGRVLEIPTKRYERKLISYLDQHEIKALLAAPDRSTWLGRRDHALLLLAIQTGLRVSELCALRVCDLSLSTGAHCRVIGKGRKARCAMLTAETVATLRVVPRAQGTGRRSAVPHPPRRATHTQSDRLAARQAHHYRRDRLPVTPQKARDAPRPASLRGRLGYVAARGVSAAHGVGRARSGHIICRVGVPLLRR
jgi:integrase/recombinase XerD